MLTPQHTAIQQPSVRTMHNMDRLSLHRAYSRCCRSCDAFVRSSDCACAIVDHPIHCLDTWQLQLLSQVGMKQSVPFEILKHLMRLRRESIVSHGQGCPWVHGRRVAALEPGLCCCRHQLPCNRMTCIKGSAILGVVAKGGCSLLDRHCSLASGSLLVLATLHV